MTKLTSFFNGRSGSRRRSAVWALNMTRKFLILLGLFTILPALATGSAFASTVRIVVPAHDIARGDTIGDNDLTYATVDGAALMSGVPTKIDEVKGMQARRTLSAGQAFRGEDVRRPIVVTKGQTVTMQFIVPGVELTAMGRAMSEGGIGDIVTIQNPVSYRMISGTVIAPGTVRATGAITSNTFARR
jgi:flagella basal body P-ring formation protein FlgA